LESTNSRRSTVLYTKIVIMMIIRIIITTIYY